MILQAKVLIVIDRDGFNLMGINQMENPLANQQLLRESSKTGKSCNSYSSKKYNIVSNITFKILIQIFCFSLTKFQNR